MKFKTKEPQRGETREVIFFAFFPITISDGQESETRWLETVKVLQKYHNHWINGWIDVKFLN